MKKYTIAVGSGKGGVGKSTVALNLAVIYAQRGISVGLFDLDPLSNASVILGLEDRDLEEIPRKFDPDLPPENYRFNVLPRLDLLFPRQKTSPEEISDLGEFLHNKTGQNLLGAYQVIILDLPAGIGREENLTFLPLADCLVIVTNPEPTAHVSAGGYIKAAAEIRNDLPILLWHNKYPFAKLGEFDPDAVVFNYNRFAPDDLKIDEETAAGIAHVAFIPQDPALNLLRTDVSVRSMALWKISDSLEVLWKRIVDKTPIINENKRFSDTVKYQISSVKITGSLRKTAKETAAALGIGKTRTDTRYRTLEDYLIKLNADPITKKIIPLLKMTEEGAKKILQDSGFGSLHPSEGPSKLPPKLIQSLLEFLKYIAESGASGKDPFIRNTGGILLFYTAALKLFESEKITQMLYGFLPKKEDTAGRIVRDRTTQISCLIKKNEEYHQKYFKLIKQLFPVYLRQLTKLAETFGFTGLIFRQKPGGINRNAYLKLMAAFIHDTVNSGLGISAGFKYNRAAEEIRKGAERILSLQTANSYQAGESA